MEKNKRKNRQDEIREAAKYTKACINVPSFEAGAKSLASCFTISP